MVTKRKKKYIEVEEIEISLMFSSSMAAVKLQTGCSRLIKSDGALT